MASITERLAPPFWVDAKVVGGLEQPLAPGITPSARIDWGAMS